MNALSPMAQQLVAWYSRATEAQRQTGRSWYSDQRDIIRLLADAYSLPVDIVAGVVSALSPQTPWAQNIAGAARVIRAWHHREDAPPRNATLYYSNALKAWRILNGETTTEAAFSKAPKTRAFWRNLSGDESDVTVDVWMLRACGDDERARTGIKTPKQYATYADAIREAARYCGESPAQFQAIVWTAIRGEVDQASRDSGALAAVRETLPPHVTPWLPERIAA